MKGNSIAVSIIYFLILFVSVILPSFILPTITSTYQLVINPIMWIIAAIIAFFVNVRNRGRNETKKTVIKSVTIVTLIYIIIYYLSGIIFGYLNTPYGHSLEAISKNIFSIFIVVILQEYVRYVLVSEGNKNKAIFASITMLFILANMEWSGISQNFIDGASAFKYISSYIIPKIAENILCTYLVLNGTNLASTIYRGIITLGLIFVPIVPDLNWFFTAIATLLISFYIFVKVNYEIKNKEREVDRRHLKKQKPYKLIPFAIVVILGVCFVAGVFKYVPVAVLSNSMLPEFSRGDAVIIKKLKPDEIKYIKEGDIIEYTLQNRFIIHRVIAIVDNVNYIYRTKGDNNNAPDAKLVKAEQIVGIVKHKVPFIGYPSVFFSEIISISPPEDINT